MSVGSMIDGSCIFVSSSCRSAVISRCIHGMERFPKNLIIGVRSAAAEACRRALVANIFEVGLD